MNRKCFETDDAVAIEKLAQKTFRSLVKLIVTSSTEYWYKLVGAGPECLSTFLNVQNNDDWLEVLSLIGIYNKEKGRFMEQIAGKSELNTFNVLSKEWYDQQIREKKKFIRAKREWFIKLGYDKKAENSTTTIPKDQYNKKRYHFLVKTPPTLRLDKTQQNLVK